MPSETPAAIERDLSQHQQEGTTTTTTNPSTHNTTAAPSHHKKLRKRSAAPTPPGHFDSISPSSHLSRSPSAPSRSQSPNKHSRSPTIPNSGFLDASFTNGPGPGSVIDHAADRYPSSPAATAAAHALAPTNNTYNPRLSVTHKSSTDLLGQRFDSADILSNLNAISYNANYTTANTAAPPTFQQYAAPLQPASQSPHSRPVNPSHSNPTSHIPANVELSTSLAASGRRMEDLSTARNGDPNGARSPRQRDSGESGGTGGAKLKKKSGFSNMISSLVGTPRKPTISAPENPVHVTHVGYDQETGEFTVCLHPHIPCNAYQQET